MKALSQPMHDHEIQCLESRFHDLQVSVGDLLCDAFLLALNEVRSRSTVSIAEAYVMPDSLDSAGKLAIEIGWKLTIFTEEKLPGSERLDLLGDAWVASGDAIRRVDFFTLESSGFELDCAVREGIRIYP